MLNFSSIRRSWMHRLARFSNYAFLLVFILVFPLIVHSDQQSVQAQSVTKYKLLILGDSLSAAYGMKIDQGWVALMDQKWQKQELNITVINAAISGDTSDGGLARLPRLLELHQPTHLYLELGGNNGLQGHNPNKIKQNLSQIIEISQAASVQVILQEIQIPTNFGTRYTNMFVSNYHSLAEEYNVPLIPFFMVDIALNSDLMFSDGIHPNVAAQDIIAEKMANQLLKALQN